MNIDAENRDEAVAKFKGMMSQAVIDEHMANKHPDQPSMTEAECHMMIEKDVQEVAA